jgi:ATP-dependent Clp protease protease subunit
MSRRYSKDDIDKFHDYDFWLPDNTLYIGSQGYVDDDEAGVDFRMAEKIIKNLHILDRSKHSEGITIKMNNPGGCVNHGLAIYDAIITCQNRVKIIAYGQVSSMGSLIFQAGDERFMTRNCRIMLHNGQLSVGGESNNVYANIEENKNLDNLIYNIYLKKIKEKRKEFSRSQLVRKMAKDWYMGPEEAIENGLCDGIWDLR